MSQQIDNIKLIVNYFLKKAAEYKFPVGKVRITKLIYLLDIEYFKIHQNVFTGLNWIYYLYGPYALELEEIYKRAGIDHEDVSFDSDKIFKQIKVDILDENSSIPCALENIMNRIWAEWGLENINKLLDYIYYETSPMISAKRGEKLDFNKVLEVEKNFKIVWSDAEKRKLVNIGKSLKEKLKNIKLPKQIPYKIGSFEANKIWDEEEISDINKLEGKVKIENNLFKEYE